MAAETPPYTPASKAWQETESLGSELTATVFLKQTATLALHLLGSPRERPSLYSETPRQLGPRWTPHAGTVRIWVLLCLSPSPGLTLASQSV